MIPIVRGLWCVVVYGGVLAASSGWAAEPVSVSSLLSEMTDYDAVARWPDPPYTCQQASSYNRDSKTADDAQGWFANKDENQFIRSEKVGDRLEKVMMDADGPGAIVRFWLATGPLMKGTIRMYLDGAQQPTMVVPSFDFMNHAAVSVGEPLLTRHLASSLRGRGGSTLYLPIPYSKHCKVTWEEGETDRAPRYYQINYRTYPRGTKVEPFQPGSYQRANQALAQPPTFSGGKELSLDEAVPPGKESTLSLPPGPAAVRVLELRIDAARLRTLVLRAEFDGEPAIWCPVADFFGSGVGLNALDSWYRTVKTEGVLTCRWVMPYQKTARFSLLNLGKTPVPAKLTARVGDWRWDERSLHFRANWRQQSPIATRPFKDWNYITITGQGVYVGDSLTVLNPTRKWWGEGDEKIFVDGETFPSHFGTGTEDYYNYSWSDPNIFQTPFANQVRCDGPRNFGCSVVSRTRNLDAIPFTRSLRFDMEVWHHHECQVGYAATTYWYARPGATCNRHPSPDEVVRELPVPALDNAQEAEVLKVAKITGGLAEPQDMASQPGYWSGTRQLHWHGGRVGDTLTLELPVAKEARYAVFARLTRGPEYGMVQFSLDDKPLGPPIDLYHQTLTTLEPRRLDAAKLTAGIHRLTLTLVEDHSPRKAAQSSRSVGIDYFALERVPPPPRPAPAKTGN